MKENEACYWRIRDFIDNFKITSENRGIFLELLMKVEKAVRYIEWVDKKEIPTDQENKYILDCIGPRKSEENKKNTDIFPLTKWKEHFDYPSYGAIRNIVMRRKENGAGDFLIQLNGRHYVDKKRFIVWFQMRSLKDEGKIKIFI